MAKKLTRLQQEYEKEIARLRKGFKRYEKQGFVFPEENYGQRPSRVTKKKLESIKQVKPKELTSISERFDIETGEILTPQPSKPTPQSSPSSAPQQEQEYIPDLTIVDAIRDRIAELPDVNLSARGGIPIAGRRNGLLALLEDNINARDGQELADYIEYLYENQSTLLHELERIRHESKDEKIEQSFAHAGEILNGGRKLTGTQSETISLMQEYS